MMVEHIFRVVLFGSVSNYCRKNLCKQNDKSNETAFEPESQPSGQGVWLFRGRYWVRTPPAFYQTRVQNRFSVDRLLIYALYVSDWVFPSALVDIQPKVLVLLDVLTTYSLLHFEFQKHPVHCFRKYFLGYFWSLRDI